MVVALVVVGAEQAEADYLTLSPPGATATVAYGISGNNIVGYYESGGSVYGFLYNGSSYTTLEVPGMDVTIATGVSGNNVIGFCYSNGTQYGFLYNSSTYTTLFRLSAILAVFSSTSVHMRKIGKEESPPVTCF
jgi:hypothetical protein